MAGLWRSRVSRDGVAWPRRSLPSTGARGGGAPKRSAGGAFQPIVAFGARQRAKSAEVPRPGQLGGSAASSSLAQVCPVRLPAPAFTAGREKPTQSILEQLQAALVSLTRAATVSSSKSAARVRF